MNVEKFNNYSEMLVEAFEELKEENRELVVEISSLKEKVDDLEEEVIFLEDQIEKYERNLSSDNEDVSLPWSQALELLNLNKDYIDPLELFEWIDKRAVIN